MSTEIVANCPICNSSSFSNFLSCQDFTVTNQIFQLKKCQSCGFIITSPRPGIDEIGKYYESDNYISHSGGSKKFIDKLYLIVRKYTLNSKRKIIESHSQKGSLLDYGCGTGDFLNTCIQHGWKGTGVEPSTAAREKAELTTQSKIIKENITQLFGNQYNTITLWHVLEHIHDLNQKLTDLTKLLDTKGTIFIAVPNHEAWDSIKYKEHWAAYDVPRHLWHFSKENMTRLLAQHGLRVIKIKPMKFDSFYVSLLSEGYKNAKGIPPTKLIKAFTNGMISNLKARKKMNYSSLIYIAQK
jgi:2-polyprenyl-3-methyl-5-hydroxy-6-metoxy-1,4-benzoquinol methylase